MDYLTIFDELYPKFKITKPIRLIEFFAGYGSQALALKYLGVKFEHWKICEWAVKSIQAYKDIHFPNEYHLAGVLDIPKEEIIDFLYKKGISSNYNEPMTKQQIMRLSELQRKTIFNNICATHNLVNIQQVKGKDLEIVDKDKYDYILTYSFPCQDLSLAGKGKGMSDTSTRSGMLWEVERILKELKETDSLPQVLLMENVPQVHSVDNTPDFNKWQIELTKLGYKNYWEDLIATDYGIPQTRNRCFMVSILGDYNYSFPKSIPLEKKLKDLLEDNVDEKYFLSDKMLEYCLGVNQKESDFPRGERFLQSLSQTNDKNLATTITTNAGNRPTDNFIKVKKDTENYIEWEDGKNIQMNCRAWKDKVGTLNTGGETKILIKNSTKKGYLEATDGDGVDTLKKELCNKLIEDGLVQEGDIVKHSYTSQILDGNKKCVEKNDGNMITLTTRGDCVGTAVKDNMNNLRIRKLTPKECFRLMGVKDEDFEKVKVNQSDSSLYHLAGDSIVVNVLMAIFKELI